MERTGTVVVGDYIVYVCKACGADTELREGEEPTPDAPWPYMHGTLLRRRRSGEPRIVEGTIENFHRRDVVAFGKAAFHRRVRIMCMVRLRDGREVSVKATRQRRDRDSVWLYVVSKKVPLHHHQYVPSLEEPFIEQWVDV
jgi:hypothetical protein